MEIQKKGREKCDEWEKKTGVSENEALKCAKWKEGEVREWKKGGAHTLNAC